MTAKMNLLTETIRTGGKSYEIISTAQWKKLLGEHFETLPLSVRILFETVALGHLKGIATKDELEGLSDYDPASPSPVPVPFLPGRVLLQDFTGVPALVDLAAMRSAMHRMGKEPGLINPQVNVDLVIDHSVQVDYHGTSRALADNVAREYERNDERYSFIKWGAQAFDGFTVIPPGNGICHQVNLERLAPVVATSTIGDRTFARFDTLVGTDSHTPMIGGLGVLGWGVGGIEAEAAMLGQPIHMNAPEVVGVELTGALPSGATATDLVLTITQILRAHGVVGKFVEYHGDAVSTLTVPDRATIANMAPEYGATVGFFPIDDRTLDYMSDTGRTEEQIELTKTFCQAQGVFGAKRQTARFAQELKIDLSLVEPSLAGPRRPQDRVSLSLVSQSFSKSLEQPAADGGFDVQKGDSSKSFDSSAAGKSVELKHGHVAIAAVTSCTNTSNPSVMLAAGLVAKKAVELGLKTKPWVKTSLAPGSTAVTDYLVKAGLLPHLESLGFHIAGYGCTTCIGNSGPLVPGVEEGAKAGVVLAGVLSGNRNFEGRIHPHVRANYLASPPLVVAYALAGSVAIDLSKDPLSTTPDGRPVTLSELWPGEDEIIALLPTALSPEMYRERYAEMLLGDAQWRSLSAPSSSLYDWPKDSTYIKEPPFFEGLSPDTTPFPPIENARALLVLGDTVTTDHISPAGAIPKDSPAAGYLESLGVERNNFNSFGSRRGNDRVMTRGTFGNIRIRNRLVEGREGGFTLLLPEGRQVSVFEAAKTYQEREIDTIVLAGKDYGMGSSRDWAAKGTRLLGVRAVIAESYERIHRSNLVGMGVLPLQFPDGQSARTLGLSGKESFSIELTETLSPGEKLFVKAVDDHGGVVEFQVLCRLDNLAEVVYLNNGGILTKVLRDMFSRS